MADIEKVIKALEVCSKIDDSCKNCPYSKYKDVEDCSNTLLKDVLELLKEYQEKIETARKWLKEDSVDIEFIAKRFVI